MAPFKRFPDYVLFTVRLFCHTIHDKRSFFCDPFVTIICRAFLYRRVRSERSGAWNYTWKGTHQESDQQHPDLRLRKGARGSGAVPRFTEVPRTPNRSTEVPATQYGASRWRHIVAISCKIILLGILSLCFYTIFRSLIIYLILVFQ